ncbi:VPS10 domain-containing protein [Fodinibius sp. AD559]|uniref:VPS10 domain-containing protein n=1 Tax=Fodinibius sp. AD559 TaxID=3424179 RepID=UPI004046C548
MKIQSFSCFLALFVLFTFPFTTETKAQSTDENQVVDPSFLEGLEYRSIGPYRGGRVTAVEGVTSKPHTFFMGSTGGGVWQTTDAGETWTNISDGQIKAGSIGSIEVSQSDPNVIYVGTGSDAPRGNISAGIGIYKTTDGGKTWKHAGLREGGQIGEIRVHPDNPDLVYAAVLGNIFGPNEQRGVFRSEDGGKTWEKVMYISDKTGAVDVEIDPNNPRIIYAGFWRAERNPWALIDGGPEGGVYKSKDSGDTWERVTGGLPEDEPLGKVDIAISPANSDRLWVMQQTQRDESGGLYRSSDGGETWEHVNNEHRLRQRAWYYTHIFADPQDQETVFVLNTGFYKSTDAGESFDEIDVPHGDVHSLWLNPNNPDVMVNSNDGGANVSVNGGKTWTTQKNQPTAEFYRVEVDDQFPYRVYGAQQDNSTISIPNKMPGDVTPKQYWYSVGGGESGHIAVHPNDSDIVYAGSYSGEITRFHKGTGQTLQMTAYPHYTEGTNMTELKYRFQWNFPIVISEHAPDTMYVTSQYVHRSTDGGFTWDIISPDLTTNDPEYLDRIPGGPIQHDATGVEVYSSIFSFTESPHQRGELWAGSDDGLVHISENGGESWEEVTPDNMPEGGTVNAIELSEHDPGTAYIAVYKYREADFSPYIFKTENYGQSWEQLTNGDNGIPDDHFVRVVREDPDREGLLYAGTEFGMYISFDDGQHWQSFQQNLPHTPITDIEVHRDDLVLSTQGRSFWVLDDLSPLHQLDNEIENSNYHLFNPRDAYRTQLRGSAGSSGPDSYPTGALINFYLDKKAADKKVDLDILNKSGETIRSFSTDSEELKERNKLEVSEGLNRFEWDLNHEGPFTVDDLVTMVIGNPPRGPEAAPGTYLVRLSIGEEQLQESFQLKADPRWNTTTENLQATYKMANEIADMITSFQQAIDQIRSVRRQIESISENKSDSQPIQDQAKALNRKLTEVENKFINNDIKSGQDPIGMERRLSNRMGRLYQVVRDHDAKPTGGMEERFKDLKKVYEKYMGEFNTIVNQDIQEFNNLLDQQGVDHIILDK